MSKFDKAADKVTRNLDRQLSKGKISQREHDRQKFGVIVYRESRRGK